MNPPLGLIDAKYVAETMTLEPGTGLIVMTDGVTESRSPEGETLDPGGVLRALDGAGFASSKDLVHVVTEAASAFREHLPAHDDLTVLALRLRATST
jgi:sigma-B regulation protein RsbU (phosphoserine phosphatase)